MTENKPLTFKGLLSCLQQADEVVGDNDVKVEVWVGDKMYRIVRVGQFGIVPDVTLTLADEPEVIWEDSKETPNAPTSEL